MNMIEECKRCKDRGTLGFGVEELEVGSGLCWNCSTEIYWILDQEGNEHEQTINR